jgi:ABC-type Na+ transport system ATPase subunit NatA
MRAASDASRDRAPEPPVLEARGIVKHFGRVIALDHTDFDLRANEILGVIGDNGAGKSTSSKYLAGAIIPDTGEVLEGLRLPRAPHHLLRGTTITNPPDANCLTSPRHQREHAPAQVFARVRGVAFGFRGQLGSYIFLEIVVGIRIEPPAH